MSLCYCLNKITGDYDLITIEEDPIFLASPAGSITWLDIANWNSGGGGGGEPLFTAWLSGPPNISTFTNDSGYITTRVETDPVFSARLSSPPNISIFTNDAGYITSWGPETDPVFSAWLLTSPNISSFTNDVGYITSVPIKPLLYMRFTM